MLINKSVIKVTLVRSPIGRLAKHRACVNGLGLKRMWHSVQCENTSSVRGIVDKIKYMLKIEINYNVE